MVTNSWEVRGNAYKVDGSKVSPSDLQITTGEVKNQGDNGTLDVAVCRGPTAPTFNITFVVVWGDENSGTPYDVYLSVYNASPSGVSPLLTHSIVNTYPFGSQGSKMENLSVAMDQTCTAGVVTWGEKLAVAGSSPHDDTNGDIFAREFTFDGQMKFQFNDINEWRVNTNITNRQWDPDVSINGGDSYVISWTTNNQSATFGLDIMARRFAFNPGEGPTVIDNKDFNASEMTSLSDDYSSVTSILDNGYFLVGWTHDTKNLQTGLDAYGIAYDNNRHTPYPPMCMTLYSGLCLGDQYDVAASSNRTDTWIWTWTDNGRDGSYEGVYGWVGTWDTMKGDVFRVAQTTLGNQSLSDVGMSLDGKYVIVWASEQSPKDVYGRLYNDIPNVPELNLKWTISVLFMCGIAPMVLMITRKRITER
jgi:hypothetical protein